MFEELVPIVKFDEWYFYIRLWEFTYDLEMNRDKKTRISNDFDHLPFWLYNVEYPEEWFSFNDIRIKSLYSVNKLNWNAAFWKISDLIYEYENYEEEDTMNDIVNEVNEDRTSKILEDAWMPTYNWESDTKLVSGWITHNWIYYFIWWIQCYTSTVLTRQWVDYRTLQWDKYIKVNIENKNFYILVKDIVDKFLIDNWIENGNKEKE